MIEVTYEGLQTIIVTTRRHGMESLGVPNGGPMDVVSCILANRLVGNDDTCGVLEMTLMPAGLLFRDACTVAITGGESAMFLTRAGIRMAVPMNETISIQPGDSLRGNCLNSGLRTYLAVSGGIVCESIRPTVLHKGDMISCGCNKNVPCRTAVRPFPIPEKFRLLRVIEGAHISAFSTTGVNTFLTNTYTYRQESNRMGIRLNGAAIKFAEGCDGNIISEGVVPGDIQVSSDGLPIMMMADCQTIGGYTKIAHLISADMPIAAQLRPGDRVRFRFVSVEEAQDALRKMKKTIDSSLR